MPRQTSRCSAAYFVETTCQATAVHFQNLYLWTGGTSGPGSHKVGKHNHFTRIRMTVKAGKTGVSGNLQNKDNTARRLLHQQISNQRDPGGCEHERLIDLAEETCNRVVAIAARERVAATGIPVQTVVTVFAEKNVVGGAA